MLKSLLKYMGKSKLVKTAALLIPLGLAACGTTGIPSPTCNEKRTVACGHNQRGTQTEQYKCPARSWEKSSGCNDQDQCELGEDKLYYTGPSGTEGNCPCQSGLLVCKDTPEGAKYLVEEEEILPTTETCNDMDDDCDGDIDNGFNIGQLCFVGEGRCMTQGYMKCAPNGLETVCNAFPREPTPETCDYLDNDCDGTVDNGFNVGQPCTSGLGECSATGTYVCNFERQGTVCDTAPTNQPTQEICDNKDNDCDGNTDENLTLEQPCGTSLGECTLGVEHKLCENGQYTEWLNCNARPPTEETCDGKDNNCDGVTDEGCLIVFDDMEDGVIDWNKWTLVENYNSEHGSNPYGGFQEQDGAIGGMGSFSYSGDRAWYRFNTFNRNTGEPAFDFQQPQEISLDSYLSFRFRDSCFGEGFGEYYLIDQQGNKAKFHEFKATGNGENIEEKILKLKKEDGELNVYHDEVFQSIVDTSSLDPDDKWSIEFYSYLASGNRCSNSAYLELWIREINYTL